MLEAVAERVDEVSVHLHGRAPPKDGHLVAAQGQALPVAVARLVGVEDLLVLISNLQHPARQRDLASVAHVAAGCMEAHDGLNLEACGRHLCDQTRTNTHTVCCSRLTCFESAQQLVFSSLRLPLV